MCNTQEFSPASFIGCMMTFIGNIVLAAAQLHMIRAI